MRGQPRRSDESYLRFDGVPSLSSPVPASGAFIDWWQNGLLRAVSRFLERMGTIERDIEHVQKQLCNLNDPSWLARFALGPGKRDFDVKVRRKAQMLEAKLRRLRSEREQLREQGHVLPVIAVQPNGEASVEQVGPLKQWSKCGRGRGQSSAVKRRNAIIRKYRHFPHRAICDELDDAFRTREMRERVPEFPRQWFEHFGVRTFRAAYLGRGSKNLVQRLISGAKASLPP